jgi:glycosyltransferase involved in cell wall biosynthesis
MMTSAEPWLSILIPVYNVENYIEECIQSITNQNLSGVEIIALDDCSTDGSLARLQNLSAIVNHPINILRHASNRGLSAARNSMMAVARGTYIWFIDSDDILNPNAIDELKAIAHKYSPDLVMCDFNVLRSEQKTKHIWRGENHVSSFSGESYTLAFDPMKLFDGIYQNQNLHIWSKISKRRIWAHDLRFPEGKLMEDMVVTPQLALRVQSYYHHPKPWIAYRQRPDSILKTLSPAKINDSSTANANTLSLWLKKYPNMPAASKFIFSYFCIKIHIGLMRELRNLNNAEKINWEIYRERLFSSIQMNKKSIYLEYLKRLWLLRLIRFVREH